MPEDIYKNYTSTSVLAGENDLEAFLSESIESFENSILPHLPVDRNSRILEVGCGFGRYTHHIVKSGYEQITGIDISREQIDFGLRHLNLGGFLKRADAVQYLRKVKKASYDCILIIDVLEHLELEYSISLLERCRDTLAPGGLIITQVPNMLAPFNIHYLGDVTHKQMFSEKSISQLFRMAGFKNTENFAVFPVRKSFLGKVRYLAWRVLINPVLKVMLVLLHGRAGFTIFTANMVSVTRS